ncbi:MAG: DNA polymerase III subunit delta [Firmicutes bacterium]|nr:DNA polymerase III subunit delta [Bacillota bacterium]
MDAVRAIKSIEMGDVAPAYLLWGSRAFHARVVEVLRRCVVDRDWEDLNYSNMDGKTSAAEVVGLARSAPFGSGKKLIVVSDPPYLRKGADDGVLQAYLKDPADWTILVFLLDEKPPQSAAVRSIDEAGGLVDCSGRGSAVVEWVRSRVKDGGKAITPEALWAICEMSSGDADFLDTEVDKIITYAHDEPTITIAHVNEVGFGHSDARVFDLLDSIMDGDTSTSVSLAASLELAGEDLQRIMQTLAWHFRTLYRFKHLTRRGMGAREAAREAGIREFLIGKFSKQAGRLTNERIASCLEAILDTDVAVKSGLLHESGALDTLIVRLCKTLGRSAAGRDREPTSERRR